MSTNDFATLLGTREDAPFEAIVYTQNGQVLVAARIRPTSTPTCGASPASACLPSKPANINDLLQRLNNAGMPVDPYREMQALGTLLTDPTLMVQVVGNQLIRLDDFHTPEHQLIAQAVFQLDREGRPISPASVASVLHTRGYSIT